MRRNEENTSQRGGWSKGGGGGLRHTQKLFHSHEGVTMMENNVDLSPI